ncbi:TraR/DksA family transcriptional regulator [Streptomyces sp. NPDC008313]|uniref:TraR/DksA family transcriptional regulator n=1 Tax=Streptomyces sp. NPDC008313 TaxID=3364826 RepID=UPI0036DFF806
MTLDTARPGSRPERPSAHEARQRLEHERNARMAQLKAVDDVGAEEGDPLVVSQRNILRRVLKDVDAAVARLDEGSYGTCQGCARTIPDERLEILPYARFCVACQQRAG